jgi:hypothetical protein
MSSEWWTRGWIIELSGPGLAMALILLHAGRRLDREIWFSPSVANSIYGLSADTRSAGIAELKEFGLVRVKRRTVQGRELDFSRLRNTYVLDSARLQEGPSSFTDVPLDEVKAESSQ